MKTVDAITNRILDRAAGRRRFMLGIAGPPGAGKSTLAEAVRDALVAGGETAEILPMDGFHMDNGLLAARGLMPRKGAPESFDARGFVAMADALHTAEEEILVPVFDRSREIAIASARAISAETRFILCEGNYLLLDEAPWDRLEKIFDFTVLVAPSYATLQERLRERWLHYALPEADIQWKLHGNDLPNGRRVVENSRPADLRLEDF